MKIGLKMSKLWPKFVNLHGVEVQDLGQGNLLDNRGVVISGHGAFLCTREVTKKCPYTCHTPLESYDSQLSEYVWLDIKTSSGFCRVAILVLNYKAKLLIF